jgi:uncharacterized membrane protein YdjX (TVP38/TMEM64 family)
MNNAARLRLAAVAVLVGAIAISLVFLPVKRYLDTFLAHVQQLGAWGPILWGAAYIPASILLIPGSLLTVGAGFAFGLGRGTVAVSVGSTLGATAAFLVGRTLGRHWIEEKVAGDPKFRAIDQAVGQHGFQIVLLLRLSPVFPFNLLNYALSLTNISLRNYVLASWIGMLPATVVYVYVGSAVQDVAELLAGRSERSTGEKVLFFVGLAATVLITAYLTRLAKRAFRQAVAQAAQPPSALPEGAPHG